MATFLEVEAPSRLRELALVDFGDWWERKLRFTRRDLEIIADSWHPGVGRHEGKTLGDLQVDSSISDAKNHSFI